MKAKDLIGKKVTRIAPANCRYGKDYSCMGDVSIIINADDNLIMLMSEDGALKGMTRTLSIEWCDDNWANVEEFLDVADRNLKKLQGKDKNDIKIDGYPLGYYYFRLMQ